MQIALHILTFIFSIGLLSYFAGILVDTVAELAVRLGRTNFSVAFFVLGALMAVDEFSVMVNSTLNGVPEVSVGNLIGSAFVVLIFVIPLLAIFGNGVFFKDRLDPKQMIFMLFVALLPALLVLDGEVTASDGMLALLSYLALIYYIRDGRWWWQQKNKKSEIKKPEKVTSEEKGNKKPWWLVTIRIVGGTVAIFFAGDLLVTETVYFSELIGVSSSLVGLVILAIATKVPDLTIAIHAIKKSNIGIAFGNYLGSAVATTAVFGVLGVLNREFAVNPNDFSMTIIFMIVGFIMFFIFSSTKNEISRKEGMVLATVYVSFMILQISSFLL